MNTYILRKESILMSDNRAIGVFDSGLGGLTVAREIMKLLPNEKIVYFEVGQYPSYCKQLFFLCLLQIPVNIIHLDLTKLHLVSVEF